MPNNRNLRSFAQVSDAMLRISLLFMILGILGPDLFGAGDGDQHNLGLVPAHAGLDEEEDFWLLSGAAYMAMSRILIMKTPRGPYNTFEKCPEFFLRALSYPDLWFRCAFRISRPTFEILVAELERSPVFQTTGHKPQRPVRYQLGCFLLRYGMPGGNALLTAMMMGIGLGSVFNYCARVTYALRKIGRKKWLRWPAENMRDLTKEWVYSRVTIPDCIGMLDGTLIQLTEPPRHSFAWFFCRKGFPSFNVQAIVDHLRRFLNLDLGWPGSLVDVTLLKRSFIWLNRHRFFRRGEFVLADKGYPSSPYVLRPFTESEVQNAALDVRARMRRFNYMLSSVRVRVEQAFGMLKGRFPSLKFFGTPVDMADAYRTFEALAVVHNFCIDNEDHPQNIPFYNARDPQVEEAIREVREAIERGEYAAEDEPEELPDNPETPERLKQMGFEMRMAIFNEMVPP